MPAPPRLVVRTYAPLRQRLLIGGAVLLGLFALYVAFEWGRSTAGFDGRSARIERSELRGRIRELEREVRSQRVQIAGYDTERTGQTRERAELGRTIGELQAEVARVRSELAFYRGVVGDQATDKTLRIQQFRVSRGEEPGEYLVRLVLGRPLRPEDTITGRVRMTFEGVTGGAPVDLGLAAVSSVESGELPFSYRYVETLEQTIRLPPEFVPARTSIELIPSRRGLNPVRETFIWTVEN